MRKIKTSDVFRFARLVNESGMKDELKALYEEAESGNATAIGFEAVFRLIGSVTTEEMEEKLYEFYGDIVEKTADEVRDEDLSSLMDEMAQVSAENDLKRFFSAAVKLIQ